MSFFRRMVRRDSRTTRSKRISLPSDFEHRVHVILDTETGQYVGLPSQWLSIMKSTRLQHSPRRTVSSPDLRTNPPRSSEKQNGVSHGTSSLLLNNGRILEIPRPGLKNTRQNDQDSTIERLKRELREYKAGSHGDSSSTLPRASGNEIERRNGKVGHTSTLPNNSSFSSTFLKSESSV